MAIFVLSLTWYWQAGDHKAGNSLLLYANVDWLIMNFSTLQWKRLKLKTSKSIE